MKVRALKTPGRYADGNGLYLMVEPSGAKRWLLRTMVQGRRRDIGLGGARLVSLAEAREAARRYRAIARSGGDPFAERRKAPPTLNFETTAREVYKQHQPSWRNAKHKEQWINRSPSTPSRPSGLRQSIRSRPPRCCGCSPQYG